MRAAYRLTIAHARFETGREPVREWLRELPRDERAKIGQDIGEVQVRWPIGRPLVAHLRGDIWEVRSNLPTRSARVLFAIRNGKMVLLNGFIKKTPTVPEAELRIAEARWRNYEHGS